MSYEDDLKTPEWKECRERIIIRDRYLCRDCFTPQPKNQPLHVHHCCYIPGFKPWEYPDELLLSVCDGCHLRRQTFETTMHVALARIIAQCPAHKLETLTWDFLKEQIDLANSQDPERIRELAKWVREGIQ